MSDSLKQILFLFGFFGIPAIVATLLAYRKGRNMFGWFLLGLFFPPTIMILIFQGPVREVEGHYRRCPSCSEFQSWKNEACKYCGASMHGKGEGG
jgi:hypothetical protein